MSRKREDPHVFVITYKINRIWLTFGTANSVRWRAVNCGLLQVWHVIVGTAGNLVAGLSLGLNPDTDFPPFGPIDLAADVRPDGMIRKITLN